MRAHVLTLGGVAFANEAQSVNITTAAGEITVLPGHRPLIAKLAKGHARIATPSGEMFETEVTGGFLEVRPDRDVYVLLD